MLIAMWLVLFFIVTATRPITIIYHELGHAIPALFYTKEQVSIYLGGDGNPATCFRFRVGRLWFYLSYNPVKWLSNGLCTFSGKDLTFWRSIVIIIMGPIASLVLGFLTICLALIIDVNGLIKLICAIMALSTTIDFFVNMKSSPYGFPLHDGTIVYTDGTVLRQYFKWYMDNRKRHKINKQSDVPQTQYTSESDVKVHGEPAPRDVEY